MHHYKHATPDRHTTRGVQLACNQQHRTACNMQQRACNAQDAARSMLPSACNNATMQHSMQQCNHAAQHATMQPCNTTCNNATMQHYMQQCNAQHATMQPCNHATHSTQDAAAAHIARHAAMFALQHPCLRRAACRVARLKSWHGQAAACDRPPRAVRRGHSARPERAPRAREAAVPRRPQGRGRRGRCASSTPEYPSSARRVPLENASSTPRVPLEYPSSTPVSTLRVPIEYPCEYPSSTPVSTPVSTPRVPRVRLQYPVSTPRAPLKCAPVKAAREALVPRKASGPRRQRASARACVCRARVSRAYYTGRPRRDAGRARTGVRRDRRAVALPAARRSIGARRRALHHRLDPRARRRPHERLRHLARRRGRGDAAERSAAAFTMWRVIRLGAL
jgi:hypothetical protein